jgi:hypothetical protein
VLAATSATAVSNAAATASVGLMMPLTLRTYWRAAAVIYSWVAAGSRPRNSVMFRHMKSSMPAIGCPVTSGRVGSASPHGYYQDFWTSDPIDMAHISGS